MIYAVLFDFDGTLADSYTAITASVNHVLSYYGMENLTESVVRKKVGYGLEHLMKELMPQIDPAESARIYREHHPSVMFTYTKLLPGVEKTLELLNQQQIRLAVCSNKPSAITRKLVSYLGLTNRFDLVLGPEDVEAPKPHPAMLLHALKIFGVPKKQSLYVGDMTIDIETARAAEVKVWIVATGSHDTETLKAANPDRLLASMEEFPDLWYPLNQEK